MAVQARDILAEDEEFKRYQAWLEWRSRVLANIDQAKARALGIDNKSLSTSLQAARTGGVGSLEKDKAIGIVFRIDSKSRQGIKENIKNLNIQTGSGQFVTLDQIASVELQKQKKDDLAARFKTDYYATKR